MLRDRRIELAFEPCKVHGDWLRPHASAGSRVSKVDWAAADQIDPTAKSKGSRIEAPEIDEEIQGGLMREALLRKEDRISA